MLEDLATIKDKIWWVKLVFNKNSKLNNSKKIYIMGLKEESVMIQFQCYFLLKTIWFLISLDSNPTKLYKICKSWFFNMPFSSDKVILFFQ